jgi:hypothetical protein
LEQGESPTQPGPNPFADPPLVNPCQAMEPYFPPAARSRAELRGKLVGPAVGMIVGAALSILYSVTNLVVIFTVGFEPLGAEMPNDLGARMVTQVVFVAIYAAVTIVPILVLVGAISMLRMRSYAMAKTGAILALMPCTCCFVISLPFGIWGLMVLGDIDVRAAFLSADSEVSTSSRY